MRALSVLLAGFLGVVLVVVGQRGVTEASFHCMRIHAVVGGLGGDANAQYVELRMNTGLQNLVGPPSPKTIEFRDAAGTLKATFTFPSNPANAATGDSILIGTSEFNAAVTGGSSDYTFSGANTVGANSGDPLHPVQAPGGKVAFAQGFDNCDSNFVASPGEVDSVAYGGAPADFGSAAAALPGASADRALRLGNLGFTPTNNASEYAPAGVSTSTFSVPAGNLAGDFTTPRNNGRIVLKAATASVGGIAQAPDVSSLQPAATAGDGGRGGLLVVLAAIATGAAIAGGAGAWYRHRRRA
jgi:hypothetical protein